MKNGIKKLISCIIVLAMVLTVCIGCNTDAGVGVNEKIDANKTQLYIANYNGGIGNQWLNALKLRFEEEYKDESFEEGKVGVQIIVENDKTPFEITQVIQSMKTANHEIYFTGDKYLDLVSQGLVYEITDIVTENLEEKYGEDKTIESKMRDSIREYYNYQGKYYALPHYDAFLGLTYDANLFDSRRLYIGKDGGWTNFDGERAAGPDGEENTYDDGLPATFDDFFKLCSRMKNLNIEPISWTGQHSTVYSTFLNKAIWADYEGVDSANLEYNVGSVDGKNTTTLLSFDAQNNPVFENNVTINANNYKELIRQPGRYYALKFWEEIIKGQYYYSMSTNLSQSHVMAQADYLESTFTDNPIAMLIEGSWWVNEAKIAQTFDDIESIYGDEASYESRKFGFLPMPKATSDKVGEKATLYNSLSSCFINANIVSKPNKIPLAKAFLQFANTDVSLNEFIANTGTTKSLNCTIDESTYNNLDYYTKSLMDIVEKADIVYADAYPNSDCRSKATEFWNEFYYSYSDVGGNIKNVFLNAMIYDEVSAVDYFKGMYKYI